MKVTAYVATAPGSPLTAVAVELPSLGPADVEISVRCCALCHSDLHLWRGEWTTRFPFVPGHEVVGVVTRAGDDVADLKPGDRVGLGWQCGACFGCRECLAGDPQLCSVAKQRTCVDRPGGLAERVIADHRFVYLLPGDLDDASAAPLMCAGVTVFGPLKRHGVAAGQRLGVVGFGGLGHMAVQFGAAMGATVDAFDPEPAKAADAKACGAQRLVDTTSRVALKALRGTYDLLLVTTPANLEWDLWMSLLRTGGTLCLLGVPSESITLRAGHLIDGRKSITGSVVGSPDEMRAMLDFAARHQVLPLIEKRPMREAQDAIARLTAGQARYRIVLEADFVGH